MHNNTQSYKRLPPAYGTKLRVTQKPSHWCEGELPALPPRKASCVAAAVCHPPPQCQAQGALTALGGLVTVIP